MVLRVGELMVTAAKGRRIIILFGPPGAGKVWSENSLVTSLTCHLHPRLPSQLPLR